MTIYAGLDVSDKMTHICAGITVTGMDCGLHPLSETR